MSRTFLLLEPNMIDMLKKKMAVETIKHTCLEEHLR